MLTIHFNNNPLKKKKVIGNNIKQAAIKVVIPVCVLLFLHANTFGNKNQLDSIRIISYDVHYLYEFSHPRFSDLQSFVDEHKDSVVRYYPNICFFTIVNRDALSKIENYLSTLKPREEFSQEEYLKKGVRIGLKFFYRDRTLFIALEPKYSKYLYMNGYSYGRQVKFSRYILHLIRQQYKNGGCRDDS